MSIFSDAAQQQVWAVIGRAYNVAGAAEETFYFATHGFRTLPGETPANTYFNPRFRNPPRYKRSIFSDRRTTGGATIDKGFLELDNNDAALDALADYAFDGRVWEVYSGIASEPWSTYTLVQKVVVQQAEFSEKRVLLRLRSEAEHLNVPLQATKFAGTNSGTTGNEGLPEDIAGLPKPRVFGECFNIPTRMVNSADLRFQINAGAVQAINAVYIDGSALTPGTNHANLAALEAASVTAGQFDTCLAEGFFKLESYSTGEVTADVEGDASNDGVLNGYASSTMEIMRRIFIEGGFVWPGDFDTASFTTLESANSATVGLYLPEDITRVEALNMLAESIGAWWNFNREGKIVVARFGPPSGTAAASFTTRDIIDIQRIVTSDENNGVPFWRVLVGYAKNWLVQNPATLAGGVTTARRNALAKDYRRVVDEDSAIKTAHLLAGEMTKDTLLAAEAAATTEAARLLALYGEQRSLFRLRVKRSGLAVDLGDVVNITWPRYGLAAGVDFRVVGIDEDATRNIVELDVFA